MGIACLEVPQAYSTNIGPMLTTPEFLADIGRGKERRVNLGAAAQVDFETTTALPPVMGKEWALVQQAIAGNAEAQEHLFASHAGRLYQAAFALLHNREDAEDALQDAMCKAFTSLRSFQGRSSFSTWLTRIVVNSALMTRRRKSAHPEDSLDEILHSQPERLPQGAVHAQLDPENACAAIEFHVLVEEHLRQLSPALQTAFRLRAMNGLSSTESSQALGIRENAFRSRFLRARRKLICGLKRHQGGRP